MATYKRIALFGCTVAVAGFLLCVIFSLFTSPYGGASGAGMAGLGSGLAILLGMIACAVGTVVAVMSLLVGVIRKHRRRDPPNE